MSRIVYRSNQLDAHLLDDEIQTLFQSHFQNIFKFFPHGWLERHQPEIYNIFTLFYYTSSQMILQKSPGMGLENVKWKHHHSKHKQLCIFFFLLLPWLQSRLHRMAIMNEWRNEQRPLFYRILQYSEKVYSVLKLIHFIHFLQTGDYPQIQERIVGLSMHLDALERIPRHIHFGYLNRQVIWDGVVEFVVFAWPFVNPKKMINYISTMSLSTSQTSVHLQDSQVLKCGICGTESMEMPYTTSCHHMFCFYCIKAATMDNPKLVCPYCRIDFKDATRMERT